MLATIFGAVIGLARLSTNWLVAKLAQIYVEMFRNVPLALQLFFWWGLLRGYAPLPRQAWQPLPDVFVSNRGLVFPLPYGDPAYWWMLAAFALAIAGAWGLSRWAGRRQARTGMSFPRVAAGLGLILGLPSIVFLICPRGRTAAAARRAAAARVNFAGGGAASPEFAALLLGLVAYRRVIAEIVRAGILAVGRGQSEAEMALGLTSWQRMRLIVLPQALRVISCRR